MPRRSAKEVRKEAFEHAEKYRTKDRRKHNGTDKTPDGGYARTIKNWGSRCGAKKRNGEKCTLAAGWGTPHPGQGSCKHHGGCVRSHVRKAAKDEANAEYRKLLGTPQEMNPFEAIMWCIKIRAGEVQWLSEEMQRLEEKAWIEETIAGKQFHIYVRERKDAMLDLVKFSEIAIKMGIAERYVRLAEVYGETIAKLIDGILGDLNLSDEQRKLVPMAVHRHLLLVEGGTNVEQELPVIEARATQAKAREAA